MRPASAKVPVDAVEIDISDDEDREIPEPRSKILGNAKVTQSKVSASALTVNPTDSQFNKQKLECRSFWQAGSYEIGPSSFAPVRGELEHARVHPKFLHSNATSHKWAFGAIAELLDNAVDEIPNGATFVKVDKILNVKDNSPALLFQDDGGGMDPEGIRKCMSLGYSSKKSNTTIGQYGNGFKTSTMRLGADVIVFTRSTRSGRAQSVGLLSYTFLRLTGQDDVIVPMVDFDISNNWAQPIIYGTADDWTANLKIILDWSPFSSKEELMMQFEEIGSHGTKVIVYNLWLNDEGIYELSFDDDDKDIKLRDEANRGSGTKVYKKTLELQSHISYRLRYSLRAYASILYLRKFENFKILLRGKPLEQFDIEDELLHQQVVTYKPQLAAGSKEVLVKATIGIMKGAPDLRVSGFNVYHKNRLIRFQFTMLTRFIYVLQPFWKVTRDGNSVGNGVVGVIEANFIEPAHDKQDFERSSLFIRLEARMKQMVLDYWFVFLSLSIFVLDGSVSKVVTFAFGMKTHCHFMGYQPPGVHHDRTPAEPPPKIQKLSHGNPRVAGLPASEAQKNLYSSRPSIGLTPVSLSRHHMDNVGSQNASENCEENSSAKSMIGLSIVPNPTRRPPFNFENSLTSITWMILELYCQSRRFVKRIYNYLQGTSVVFLCELNLPVDFTSSYMTMKVQQHAIHEGDFSFREAWFHLLDDYPIKYEADRLPPPLVTDLNGDGKKEVLVATHDAKIQVLEPHARRVDEGFSEARVLAEVTLLPDKVRVASGRRPVAMATGVIDRTYNQGQPLKQVLVVVTSGWSVMCFDHNLKKLWEVNLQEDFPHNAHHREVAISVSNYTIKHGDTGLVIVGGRMEIQPHIHLDPFEELTVAAKNAEEHRRSASETEPAENSAIVDLRHFAFYAFAGKTGQLRWSRKNEKIEAPSMDAAILIPQHNYKLDVHALNSRHPGEVDITDLFLSFVVLGALFTCHAKKVDLQFECREFRESVLGVMPHHWVSPAVLCFIKYITLFISNVLIGCLLTGVH
ncbi:hypothetical protein Cgig2_007447 [Carnegiea gigantea]|uniref:Morc S5 domain-containing protein n=1 Tax=Carnegiea gigantea TaxID=171969 RepID=A0A9Q1QRZ2_9CARY|nr:hypothetical protein Cgig2_007447 [Carnegiea gigantea]